MKFFPSSRGVPVVGILLGITLALSPALALADRGQGGGADRAASEARKRTGGQVLQVTPENGGRSGYRARVLTPDGKVRDIRIEPQDDQN